MSNLNPDQLKEDYIKQKPLYEEFAAHVHSVLEQEIRIRNIKVFSVSHRAKEVDSFVKKAIRKKYSSPLSEIKDKAGVRVTATYLDVLNDLSSLLHETFQVHHSEDKRLNLNPHELGYLGIHFEISLKSDSVDSEVSQFKYKGLICEIQLHTQAQNLWASISHELLYKPAEQEVPIQTQRSIFRLIALVEIFDSEIENARKEMFKEISQENYPQEIKILKKLEEYFRKFTDKSFDKELSLEIINKLVTTFEPSETSEIIQKLNIFVEANREKLQEKFDDYSNDERRNPLLFQPESLLIFERLENNSFVLKSVWNKFFPPRILESFASIWGVRV